MRPATPQVALLTLFLASVGCQQTTQSGVQPEQFRTQPEREKTTDSTPSGRTQPARPAAIVNGRSISWQALDASLRELGGDIALTDAVLDVLLAAEFERLGIKIESTYASDERALLNASIVESAGVTETKASELLTDLKRRRGLGPQRFDAFLRRNAMLRELAKRRIVESESSLTEDDIRLRYSIVYGEKVLARIITMPTQREATSVRAQIVDGVGGDSLSDRFARAAVAHSTDPTGSRGGLLEPIALADPSYEPSIRRALEVLKPGELSSIVSFENGFALLLVEEVIAATGEPLEEVRDQLRAQLEARQERLVMERFARELLESANVTIFDPSLEWAWEGR